MAQASNAQLRQNIRERVRSVTEHEMNRVASVECTGLTIKRLTANDPSRVRLVASMQVRTTSSARRALENADAAEEAMRRAEQAASRAEEAAKRAGDLLEAASLDDLERELFYGVDIATLNARLSDVHLTKQRILDMRFEAAGIVDDMKKVLAEAESLAREMRAMRDAAGAVLRAAAPADVDVQTDPDPQPQPQ